MRRKLVIAVLLIFTAGMTLWSNGNEEQIIQDLFQDGTIQIDESADEISQNIEKLEQLYRIVDRDFLFDIDHKAVYEEMAKGLFEGLNDEYSAYIVSKESTDFSEDTLGTYGGIGAYISKNYLEYRDFTKPETYMINITSVFPGSPAEAAGLLPGDLISHIDGEPVDDLEAEDSSSSLKGEAGTDVVLTIYRNGRTFEVTVTRQNIQTPTVSASVIGDDMGYLQITQFTESTAMQVQQKLEEIGISTLSSLIIDLRNNPGGIVDGTLRIADMLLDQGIIVQIHSKSADKERVYIASPPVLVPESIPVVLLVNEGSASSSEILAGALKDNERATLIGTTTYGKGLIQIVSPFDDGYYTLTWSQYKTPDGNDIHKVGIPVDIEVDAMTVAEEDMDEYLNFIQSNIANDFVQDHPEGTQEDYNKFLSEELPEERNLSDDIYRLILRRAYLMELPYDERPIADVEYDVVLKRAVEFLTTGK
ncbi:MAG: S41 family peptidase [Sphaerochaetaceae bacterium]|nr:S41 family peptidase [Sphaerochaetaceae bacterium]MDC7246972.1 S41 family peptidase [Sphaerochaetaceae bacterium]